MLGLRHPVPKRIVNRLPRHGTYLVGHRGWCTPSIEPASFRVSYHVSLAPLRWQTS